VLILRTCDKNLRSHGGFQWPESGPVEAPDYRDSYTCGHGLHGLPWGEGDGSLLNWSEEAKWLVVQVPDEDVLMGQGQLLQKCKFRAGTVVFCGDRTGATDYLIAHGGAGKSIVGSTVSGGYGSTVSGGYGSTVSGGDRSTVSGGDRSTVSGGYGSTVSGGECAITLSRCGTAKADINGVLIISYWDEKKDRPRVKVGYVGERGIKANVLYRLDNEHKFVLA
jgi:hypothetical protein